MLSHRPLRILVMSSRGYMLTIMTWKYLPLRIRRKLMTSCCPISSNLNSIITFKYHRITILYPLYPFNLKGRTVRSACFLILISRLAHQYVTIIIYILLYTLLGTRIMIHLTPLFYTSVYLSSPTSQHPSLKWQKMKTIYR